MAPIVNGFKRGHKVWSSKEINNANLYPMDGRNLVRNGNRVAFIDYIKNIRKATDYFCSEEQYISDIAKYGTCKKCVWYPDNSMLKIPHYSEKMQKDIHAYTENAVQDKLETYTLCLCYEFLSAIDKQIYTRENIQYKSTTKSNPKPGFITPLFGYMYLVINDTNLSYTLDANLPNVLLLR